MASHGGLTRRRGAGAVASTTADEGSSANRNESPSNRQTDERNPETQYTGGENGHKIAFDPRDLNETRERNKQPKLTLMEEILLMGLKDKQVGFTKSARLVLANRIH
jgi:golgi phosphoprotein 3